MRRATLFPLLLVACGSAEATTRRGPSEPPEQAMAATQPGVQLLPPEHEEKILADPTWPENVLYLQVHLARLGYYTRPFTTEPNERMVAALRAYKRDAGLPPGESVIDDALMKRVDEDQEALRQPAFISPTFVFFDEVDGFVTLQGTWVGVEENLATPTQVSEIKCDRSLGVCFEAVAQHNEKRGYISTMALVHTIKRWTREEIVATGDRALCAYTTTRINRVTKTASRTRTTTSTAETCEGMRPEDWHLRMVKGEEVWREQYRKWEERQRRILGLPELPKRESKAEP